MAEKITVTLGLPTIGVMRYQAVLSALQAVGAGVVDAVNVVPRLPVHQARTRIIETTSTTHLLFVDDDMVYTAEDIEKLKEHAQAGLGVVAGLCYSRTTKKKQAVVWEWNEQAKIFSLIPDYKIPPKLTEVDGAHVAFTLIRMDVFEIVGKYFIFGAHSYFGEDVEFMHRLKEKGIKTHLEPNAKIGHLTDQIL